MLSPDQTENRGQSDYGVPSAAADGHDDDDDDDVLMLPPPSSSLVSLVSERSASGFPSVFPKLH